MAVPDDDVTWRSLHVYYYDDRNQDALLLDAVRPFLAEVESQVEGAYVLRHWRQGPHLRIRVRARRTTWERVVWPRAAAIIGDFLRERPSTAVLDPAAALERHRALAGLEQDDGPLIPWFPDNSIQEARYDPRQHVLGSDQATALLADFYQDSTAPLFAMLDHVRGGRDSKAGLAVSLLLTVSALAPGGITRSFVSYRAHAEGFLSSCPDPAAVRATFDRAYQTRRDALAERLSAVVTTLDDPGELPPVPFVREWAALVTGYGARAAALIERGELELSVPPPPAPDTSVAHLSELHRLMLTSPAYHEAVFANPGFLRHRVVLNYTYLQLTRMGLTPLQRFRTCHLVANAVEDAYRVSAVDLVRRFVDR